MSRQTHQFPRPDDNEAYRFPVSVNGVVFMESKVALLKNARDEWELPGGKLELGESPESCVVREISEELAITTCAGSLLDTWVYHIYEGVDVLIVTFGCHVEGPAVIRHSNEHKSAGLFSLDDVQGLNMPEGYKRTIHAWRGLIEGTAS